MFSQTALMRLSYQVIESVERTMQPFVRQHTVQAWNCKQDEKQQNEDGDNNLHECETALMPHPEFYDAPAKSQSGTKIPAPGHS